MVAHGEPQVAPATPGDAEPGALAMNPFVDIHIHPPPRAYPIDVAQIATITVRCPVRGRGLVIRDLTRADEPALFAFFADLVSHGGELAFDSDAPLVPALAEIGFLVRDADIVDWPRFRVALPEPPADAPVPDARWTVSRSVVQQPAFALHPGVRWPVDYEEQDGRLDCFAGGPALWVGDPAAMVAPYWLTDDQARALAALVPGAPVPPLPAPLARALAAAGAVVPPDRAEPSPFARLADARAAFAAQDHAIVRDLVGPGELAALRRYYAALLAAGLLPFGDRQVQARYSAYNDPVGRFVHARLARTMSLLAGRAVIPSFSYFFSYVPGARLAPHKDRPQAEFSISLQLDHTPEPAGPTGWPLQFSFDDGRQIAADLAIGDAVLYHGRAVTHHRDVLPDGQRSSVLVLEYVPHDFAGLVM